MNAPAVSVIIPLYNAEKFIRQCLISVLASKFQNYEVIVVDDCSTDNSVAEVKKLLPHFDGRLKILGTDVNSGGAGVPRNLGLEAARGKYVTFVDNDDLILPTALEDFYNVAEEFNADVVHTEKCFMTNNAEANFQRGDLNLVYTDNLRGNFVESATIETVNTAELVKKFITGGFSCIPWGKLYRREFLTTKNIKFPQTKYAEDIIPCFECAILAKIYVRIPHITNIHRLLQGSAGRMILYPSQHIAIWFEVMLKNIATIDNFMRDIKFFADNPKYRGDVLDFVIGTHFDFTKNLFEDMDVHEVQKIFYDALNNPKLDKYSDAKNIVAAYLFTHRALRI